MLIFVLIFLCLKKLNPSNLQCFARLKSSCLPVTGSIKSCLWYCCCVYVWGVPLFQVKTRVPFSHLCFSAPHPGPFLHQPSRFVHSLNWSQCVQILFSIVSGEHVMEERAETELISIPATPRASTPEILTPSGVRSPRGAAKSWTPTSFLSPIGTPMKRVLINMKGYLEEVGHLTKLNPQDAWLPITESRNGNAQYAAFHNLNAGVGFQALLLPVAFSFLGWYYLIPNFDFSGRFNNILNEVDLYCVAICAIFLNLLSGTRTAWFLRCCFPIWIYWILFFLS